MIYFWNCPLCDKNQNDEIDEELGGEQYVICEQCGVLVPVILPEADTYREWCSVHGREG